MVKPSFMPNGCGLWYYTDYASMRLSGLFSHSATRRIRNSIRGPLNRENFFQYSRALSFNLFQSASAQFASTVAHKNAVNSTIVEFNYAAARYADIPRITFSSYIRMISFLFQFHFTAVLFFTIDNLMESSAVAAGTVESHCLARHWLCRRILTRILLLIPQVLTAYLGHYARRPGRHCIRRAKFMDAAFML